MRPNAARLSQSQRLGQSQRLDLSQKQRYTISRKRKSTVRFLEGVFRCAENRCREDFRKCGQSASQLEAQTLDAIRQLYDEAESIYRKDVDKNGNAAKRPVLSKLKISKPGEDCLTSCTDAFGKEGKLAPAQQRALAGHQPYFLATRYYTKKLSFGNHPVRKLANMNCEDLLRIEFQTDSSEPDAQSAVRSVDENAPTPENKVEDSDLPSSKPTSEDIAKLVDSYEHRISGLEKSLDELKRAHAELLKSHTELKQRQETNNKEIQEASSQQLQCQTQVDTLEESVHGLQTDVDRLKFLKLREQSAPPMRLWDAIWVALERRADFMWLGLSKGSWAGQIYVQFTPSYLQFGGIHPVPHINHKPHAGYDSFACTESREHTHLETWCRTLPEPYFLSGFEHDLDAILTTVR
ncbi:autophagy protein 16 (ATG16) domain-containing protein [Pochonia chlamydosporia 170]|uniref:Autophagy protein 16 (ATG16) domain-containing protein n=1 Tax=Pochonia chlamydosporia 170 TaxID=1380566 RepID=A0A179FYP2_METCM|nr:autophagy protein 16 (ATG16) domain-containing protein [Pochonia chlamydosporia 170]OAQ70241.1 autophagy protein 16 (ATG16) domain-containing protein [Pochonia chlamydosporia 170]